MVSLCCGGEKEENRRIRVDTKACTTLINSVYGNDTSWVRISLSKVST
jgi:hypothetical protein